MTPCLLKRYILEEPALLLVSGLHGNILLLKSLHESPFYHSVLFLSHWKPKSITEAISICSPNLLVCHFYQRGQPGCLRNISLRPPPGADYLITHLAQQSISDFSQDFVANTCFVSQDSSCSTSPASSASQSSWRSRQLNFRTVWHARLGTQEEDCPTKMSFWKASQGKEARALWAGTAVWKTLAYRRMQAVSMLKSLEAEARAVKAGEVVGSQARGTAWVHVRSVIVILETEAVGEIQEAFTSCCFVFLSLTRKEAFVAAKQDF